MVFEQFNRFFCCEAEAFTDDSWVNILFDEVFASLEQLSGENNCGGRSIVAVLLLSFRNFNDHFRCWMVDVHFFEDGSTVIGDDNVAHRIDEHLVHAFGAEG